ncbi:MAG: DUF2244 domain-containing protein [Pseudomonadales bacterium]|jgi:uncharacterized membrane protein|nr:DUF2244 domain-containing protein [Pseudomonadales bacterium]
MVISHTDADATVVTLLPNRSATWVQTRLFVLVVCATTLVIGLFWTFMGAWMVLPFSGLEAALVAFFMYRVCQGTYQRQVITCAPEQIVVQFGTHFPKRSWTLARSSAHLSLTDAPHPLTPRTLRLVDAAHDIELGRFLNQEDKEDALRALKQTGLYVRHFNADGRQQL